MPLMGEFVRIAFIVITSKVEPKPGR